MEFLSATLPRRLASRWYCVLWILVLATTGRAQSENTTPRVNFPMGKNSLISSSPAVGPGPDHTIYVGIEYDTQPGTGRVVAISPSGSMVWSKDFPKEMLAAPVVSADGGTVYIGGLDGVLYALNSATGNPRWTSPLGPSNWITSAVALARDGTIYVGVTDPTTPGDSFLQAVSSSDGKAGWAASGAGAMEGSPVVGVDGTVYFGAGKQFYAVSSSGERKWIFDTDGVILATPALGADGTIYFGADADVSRHIDARFYALTPDKQIKWSLPISVETGVSVGPDGTVYIGTTDGYVHAIGPAGKEKDGWPVDVNSAVDSVPAIRADGTIIFGGTDHFLYAYNPDGSQRWKVNLGDELRTSPVVDSNGSFYIASRGQTAVARLFGFAGSGYGLSRYASWPMFGHDVSHSAEGDAPVVGGTLINLATRGPAGPGTNLIGGFVVRGTGVKPLLIRGVGPALHAYGVNVPLPNPSLTVHEEPGNAQYFNDDWNSNADALEIATTASKVGAFPLQENSTDGALLMFAFADPRYTYSTTIESVGGGSGVAMVETYDANPSDRSAFLVNLSARGQVGTGENVMIPGLVIGGTGQLRVLIRAIGPGLKRFNVNGVLAKPSISVFRKTEILQSNTGWTSDPAKGDLAGAAALVGAFSLLETDADSAMTLVLDPGAYTFHITGADGGTGEALVEVYALPH